MSDISARSGETVTTAQANPKPAWSKPVIETYDVADFTLANANNPGDGVGNET